MDIEIGTWYRVYTTALRDDNDTTIGKAAALREDRETGERLIRLDNALGGIEVSEALVVGPVELRACPQCGFPGAVAPNRLDMCPRCRATGHLFRLMTADELRESAQRHREHGYEHVAQRRERFAASLPT